MEKIFFYDLETTGVKHWKNGIHQISGAIVIDGEEKEKFNFKVQPNPQATIEDEALAIAGVDRETVYSYPPMNEIYKELIKIIGKYVDRFKKTDKLHLCGFNNAPFDNQFFRGFFAQNNDNYFGSYFWSDSIDVMCLASNYLKSERHTMPNFKLMTVAKHLQIEVDESKLHDALYGIHLTRMIYEKVK
jgi:DNA polymerase-3 subunit epsilon